MQRTLLCRDDEYALPKAMTIYNIHALAVPEKAKIKDRVKPDTPLNSPNTESKKIILSFIY